jgi:putative heme-binding domain-containing protein
MNTTIFHPWLRVVALLLVVANVAHGQTEIGRRPPWMGSRITGSPEPPRPYVTERVFPALVFANPVELVVVPGSNRLAAVEVAGKIYSFENRPHDETLPRDLFGDISERDKNFGRLYGLAFHPRFAENRTVFITYVLKENQQPDGSRLSRFQCTASDPPRLIPESEEIVLTWVGGGHNGANLQFGPDGCLYVSTGDAGSAFPPDGRGTGQDITDLEASVLRIDVDHREGGRAYRIPADNPFVNQPGARGEIWAYGFRNPWKMSFDRSDGSLWVGDVGWEKWEMIYCVERGSNFGWSVVEGPQPVHQERQSGPTPISPPAVAHSHIESRSITGGFVSQADRLPDLRGTYVYGDYVTGKIWGLRHDGSNVTWREELVDTQIQVVSFGLDHAGDVLIVDYPTGTLHRLAPNPKLGQKFDFPRKLSETGIFADTAKHVPAVGVIPYVVKAGPWEDGTSAERFIALPGDSQLDTYKRSDGMIGFFAGDWHFPDGGLLVKTISIYASDSLTPEVFLDSRRLETQILHYELDHWNAYNYIWNEEQTDAVLVENVGVDRTLSVRDPNAKGGLRRQTWHHSSRTECLLCHTSRVGTVLGFRPNQVDGRFLALRPVFRSAIGLDAPSLPEEYDQLPQLDKLGIFGEGLPKKRDPLPNLHDVSQPLELRARAYLHVNCGHCHSRGGGGASFFDIQYHITLPKTALIGTRPTQGTFGILDAQLIAPGDPYRSILYYRMSKLGHGHMPQFGTTLIDPFGTKLVHDWIASLEPSGDDATSQKLVALREQQAADAKAAVVNSPPTDAAIAKLFSSPSTALLLADSVLNLSSTGSDPKVKFSYPGYTAMTPQPGTQNPIIATGYAQPDPAIRDLFERFIPEEQRVQRLGGAIKPADILAMKGDAVRGRVLFLETAGVQCKNCHKIGEQGQSVGPELTLIGKKLDKAKILENILEPSKTIEPQFVSHLVETTGGEVHTGLLVRRTDAETVLKKADGKEVSISAAEIERSVPQQKSLMPDLLLRDLAPQQAADLLEFLAGLK